MHRPYFVLRAINIIGHILLLQADDETTCLGLHTCFMVTDLAGTISGCCFIDSFCWSNGLGPFILGKIRFVPPQLREIGCHVQNHATQFS